MVTQDQTQRVRLHSRTVRNMSKRLSWLLRHGAAQEGLNMDAAGWVNQDELLNYLKLNCASLDQVIMENNKSRFERSEGRVRASQGHSLEEMPVTREALESSWLIYEVRGVDSIWHATKESVLDAIKREGIIRGQRTHVHLASTRKSEVGKRMNRAVLLCVSVEKLRAAGQRMYVSPNEVILTRYVPPQCIDMIEEESGRD